MGSHRAYLLMGHGWGMAMLCWCIILAVDLGLVVSEGLRATWAKIRGKR